MNLARDLTVVNADIVGGWLQPFVNGNVQLLLYIHACRDMPKFGGPGKTRQACM